MPEYIEIFRRGWGATGKSTQRKFTEGCREGVGKERWNLQEDA
jgi:hypothetical protein